MGSTISRKNGGTGLGPTIVSQIIKKHVGTIELTSKVGEGTCACITLKRMKKV
ncbi:ATP-binding protein [bacterium LRH843]|nr:ATP-binding protein [bacterium LRH843]